LKSEFLLERVKRASPASQRAGERRQAAAGFIKIVIIDTTLYENRNETKSSSKVSKETSGFVFCLPRNTSKVRVRPSVQA